MKGTFSDKEKKKEKKKKAQEAAAAANAAKKPSAVSDRSGSDGELRNIVLS